MQGVIYTDGSSDRSLMAGWGVMGEVQNDDNLTLAHYEQWGTVPGGTNNYAELTAVYHGLLLARSMQHEYPDLKITIISDSMFAVDGVKYWVSAWERNGWMKRDRPVKYKELWQQVNDLFYYELQGKVGIEWVKAHRFCEGNISADNLAWKGRLMC